MMSIIRHRYLLHFSYHTIVVISLLLSALWLTWWPLSHYHFGYSTAYDLLEIGDTIDQYGPLNRYRDHFEHTSRAERERLFSAIVASVKQQGAGLENIVYHDVAGNPMDTLLRLPEIHHLEDVAALIFQWEGWGMFSMVPLALAGLARRRLSLPPTTRKSVAIVAAVWLTVATFLILMIGPTKIFYALHEWWFPPEHPWFFYYQDSLMTTLMKAPDLFGWIAALWFGSALILLIGSWWLWTFAVRQMKRQK